MPSVHVGWAILIAYGVIRVARSRWRWLALAHPLLTTYAVVVTANHFWVDGVAAGLLVAAAVPAARAISAAQRPALCHPVDDAVDRDDRRRDDDEQPAVLPH